MGKQVLQPVLNSALPLLHCEFQSSSGMSCLGISTGAAVTAV